MTVSIDRLSFQTSLSNYQKRLQEVLEDLTNNITIDSDLTVTHSEYEPIKLTEELKQRFAVLPNEVKHNYLQAKLRQFIYDNYYTQITDNHQVKASKWVHGDEFLHELSHENEGHGRGYYQPGWLIVGETKSGLVQAQKDDLTLHIQRDRHLRDTEKDAKLGDVVAVKMPPQLAEHDFYVAVGTAGSLNNLEVEEKKPQIVNIYLNLHSADAALVLMACLTKQLNEIAVPFHFKVLYRPEEYIYADTGILSFLKDDYDKIEPVIQTIYQANKTCFQPETSLFAKYLAPGLSVAEKADLDTDFAQYCCQMIAEALVDAWQQAKTTSVQKLEYIRDRFQQDNISLDKPYLNANSTDIYSTKGIADIIAE